MFHVPEGKRIVQGPLKTDPSRGNNGAFILDSPIDNSQLRIIASDGLGWEHISVSRPKRCPNWPEMCHVKDMFWDEEDCVLQYHPAKSEYIDNHPYCLHLWRPTKQKVPYPNSILVGLKQRGRVEKAL